MAGKVDAMAHQAIAIRGSNMSANMVKRPAKNNAY
jgi:hypothetical protein